MQHRRLRLLSAALLLAPLAASAEGVAITPGLWRFSTTVTLPMLTTPRVEESTECIDKEDFEPQDLMQDAGPCRFQDVVVAGNTVTWAMICEDANGTARGKGTFTSHGERAEGGISMGMQAAGQAMEVSTRWQGERVGDCN